MPPKRKAEKVQQDSDHRRQTRSSVVSGKSLAVVDSGEPRTPRKRRRDPSPEADIENSLDLRTPKYKRTYTRRANHLASVPNRGKGPEDSDGEESDPESDSPRRSGRRVIFESVEIVATRKANIDPPKKLRSRISPPSSLKRLPATTPPSPSSKTQKQTGFPKRKPVSYVHSELPKVLPAHLHTYLERQKEAILNVFLSPPIVGPEFNDATEDGIEPSANMIALAQLSDLLCGSIERGEGNSCLVIGPAGSGKSRVFEEALSRYEDEHRPIIIRLNGHVHHTDRLAIREMARQVVEQTGSKAFESIDMDNDVNPFDDGEGDVFVGSLPPPSHLPSLIAALPTLPRPVVVLLDAFNIFTEQPRQALLYCLLDTVQSCHAGSSSHRGLAVIGLTSRIDVVNFLEKRVKSRFSHRMFRTANMRSIEAWTDFLKYCLCATIGGSKDSDMSEWRSIWEQSVSIFLQDRSVKDNLRDMFGVSRDIRRLLDIMTSAITHLSPSSPFLTPQRLQQGLDLHFSKSRSSLLMKLNYPSLSLCVAAQHARTAGHDSFTFEMLHDFFATQVRTSSAAPVMLSGGSIGMSSIGKRVLMGAFEELVQMKIFVKATSSTSSLSKEFIKHRCTVERDEVKAAIDRIGQTNLKKWFSKAQ